MSPPLSDPPAPPLPGPAADARLGERQPPPGEEKAARPTAAERGPVRILENARPIILLALVGFALVLFFQTLAIKAETRHEFFIRNLLGAKPRRLLLITLGLGAMLPILASVVVLAVKRARAEASVHRLAALLGPLAVLPLLPPAFNVNLSHANQIFYTMLLLVTVLALEPLAVRSATAMAELNLGRWWDRAAARLPAWTPKLAPIVVLLGCAAYTAYTSYYTLLSHHRLTTTAYDLGIYDNLMYNSLHGDFWESPVQFGPAGGHYLAGHAEFAMLFFLPLYAIRPGPETMLVMQAFFMGFAAFPLYLFASRLLPRAAAVMIALGFLLYAPLHGPNFYDFHWLPLAMFFHFWLYFAIATRRNWLVALMVFILLCFREDVSVGLAILGVFLLLTGIRPRLGFILLVVSVCWFAVVRFVVMPLAGPWFFEVFYKELFADGRGTFASVIQTILSNPVYFISTLLHDTKLLYALHMLAPLAFLPCRRPVLLLLLLPGFFFTIMTTGYSPTLMISFQYTTHWIPYLFLATVLALVVLSRGVSGAMHRRAALATMAVVLLAHSYTFGAILERSVFMGGFSKIEFKMTEEEKQRWKNFKELLAMIPPQASVAATEQEAAHLSTRKVIYPLRWPPGPVDYIVVNKHHLGGSFVHLQTALSDPAYGLLAQRKNELFVFKRGHKAPEETAAAKKVLGLTP